MLSLIATLAVAALSGSLVQLSAPSRRMARIKRLAEVRDALVPGTPEAEWLRRRIIAETRLLRREFHPWTWGERFMLVASSVCLLASVLAIGLRLLGVEVTGSAVAAAFGVAVFFLIVGVLPALTLALYRYYRVSIWQREEGPRWASAINAGAVASRAVKASAPLRVELRARRRRRRMRRPPM